VGLIVARKPDFVDAIVQRDDAIVGHYFSYIGNQALRVDRKTIII